MEKAKDQVVEEVDSAIESLRSLIKGNPLALKKLDILEQLVMCNIHLSLDTNLKIDRVLNILERPRLGNGMITAKTAEQLTKSDRALIKEHH